MTFIPIGAMGLIFLLMVALVINKKPRNYKDKLVIPEQVEFNPQSYWMGMIEAQFLYTNHIIEEHADRYILLCMETSHKGDSTLIEHIYVTYPSISIPDQLK